MRHWGVAAGGAAGRSAVLFKSAAWAEASETKNTKMNLNIPLPLNCFCRAGRTIALFAVGLLLPLAVGVAHAKTGPLSGVCRVVDGDTIFVVTEEARTQVRLQGVAAPEDPREPGGKKATEYLKTVCEGQPVRCELDGSRTRGREVGVCYVNGADIGAAVISAGLARDCVRFSGGRYSALEKPEAARLAFPGYCSPR